MLRHVGDLIDREATYGYAIVGLYWSGKDGELVKYHKDNCYKAYHGNVGIYEVSCFHSNSIYDFYAPIYDKEQIKYGLSGRLSDIVDTREFYMKDYKQPAHVYDITRVNGEKYRVQMRNGKWIWSFSHPIDIINNLSAGFFRNFDPPIQYYNVKFIDYNGNVLSDEQIEEFHDAIPPPNPSREGYEFTKWNRSYLKVEQDLSIYAKYEKIEEPTANNLSSQLTSLKLGPNVTTIGDYAFRNCEHLEEVLEGNSLQSIGKGAFLGNVSLKNFQYLSYSGSDKGLTKIGDYAFKDCSCLNNVVLNGKQFEYFGDGAFENTGITSLVLDMDFNQEAQSDQEVQPYRGVGIFKNSKKLKNVQFLTNGELFQDMFMGCSSLTSIDFSNVQEGNLVLGDNALNGCSSLLSLDIPQFVTSLDFFKGSCLSGSSISVINMRGLDSSEFPKITEPISSYEYTVDNTEMKDFKYGKWYGTKRDSRLSTDVENTLELLSCAMENGVPVFILECNTGCGYCKSFKSKVLQSEIFNEWISKQNMFFCHGYSWNFQSLNVPLPVMTTRWGIQSKNNALKSTVRVNERSRSIRTIEKGKTIQDYNIFRRCYKVDFIMKKSGGVEYIAGINNSGFETYPLLNVSEHGGLPVLEIIWWKKNAQNFIDVETVPIRIKVKSTKDKENPQYMVDMLSGYVEKYLSAYVPEEKFMTGHEKISPTITNFDLGGLGHECVIIAKDGTTCTYVPPSPPEEQ